MPALPPSPHATPASRSTVFPRQAVRDVTGGEVTVYFSRDTVKKLVPTATGGTYASGIETTCGAAGNARGTDGASEVGATCEASGIDGVKE